MSKMSKQENPNGACIEKGEWTPLSLPPPATTNLVFTPSGAGADNALTFHMVGCSGDPTVPGAGLAVAAGMASQIANPGSGPAVAPGFLYHLGDLTYAPKGHDVTPGMWNTQFYAQYASYKNKPIFAIAGNHDGKTGSTTEASQITHFLRNMCGTAGKVSPDNTADPSRTETAQPYPYWRLDTPIAYIIGLFANVSNGGVLDDPLAHGNFDKGPQYQWLVDQLTFCREQNAKSPKAVLLALHYPPYNGTADFAQRGDPAFGADNSYPNAVPIGMVLQAAYDASGQIPDAVFSAHAHLYQRLTVSYADNKGTLIRQVPHFVAGCGGHTELELMAASCTKDVPPVAFPTKAFDLFKDGHPPAALTAPPNATVTVDFWADGVNQNNQPYGFLRVTIAASKLLCEFFATPCDSSGTPVNPGAVVLTDSCTVNLLTHLLVSR